MGVAIHQQADETVQWRPMANPYIQNDGTSSGAFLIENMYLDLNPDVVRQELTAENIYE